MKKVIFLLMAAAFVCLFTLASCSGSSADEEMATITIGLGNVSLPRIAVNTGSLPKLKTE